MTSRPCAGVHPFPVPESCRLCWLAENDSEYRELYSSQTGIPVPLPVCVYEGPVNNPCACGWDHAHVRHCLHPSDVRDFCTRGKVKGGEFQRCDTCLDREAK